jgi:hypothetical protein
MWPHKVNWLHRLQLRDRVRLPDPVRRPVHVETSPLPLHAAARRAQEARESLAIPQPVVVPVPSLGAGFETLFGCPQEPLVPVSAPAPETSLVQQSVVPAAT